MQSPHKTLYLACESSEPDTLPAQVLQPLIAALTSFAADTAFHKQNFALQCVNVLVHRVDARKTIWCNEATMTAYV